MKISVITSVFNCEKYLAASMESVLGQTLGDFEYIIVDDGSTDDSSNVLDELKKKDARINIIKNESNLGLTKSLNIALREASGDLIARQDADDISLPTRFEKQVRYLEDNPGTYLIGSGISLIDLGGSVIKKSNTVSGLEKVKKTLETRNCINHPTIMFRREPVHYYREKFIYAQDYDFYLMALTSGLILDNIPEHIVLRRVVGTSIGESKTVQQALFGSKALEFYFERKNSGVDSYREFASDEIMNIKESDRSKEVLQIKIRNAINKRKQAELRALIKDYTGLYGFEFSNILLYVQTYLPTIVREWLIGLKA